MHLIDSFTGEYAFLSNFYRCSLIIDGECYFTVEHAFQAAKTSDLTSKERIRNAVSARMAKRYGRRAMLRPDWEEIKIPVMYNLLRRKFRLSPLRDQLEATGDAVLIEGNLWGDTTWGVHRGQGHNMLGRLLMLVREENRL